MTSVVVQEGLFKATLRDMRAVVLEARGFENKGETSEASMLGGRVIVQQDKLDRYKSDSQLAFLKFESGQEVQYIFDMSFPVRTGHELIFRFADVGEDKAENVSIFNNNLGRSWTWKDRPKVRNSIPAPSGKRTIHARAFTTFAVKLKDAALAPDLSQYLKEHPQQISEDYREAAFNARPPSGIDSRVVLKMIGMTTAGLIAFGAVVFVVKSFDDPISSPDQNLRGATYVVEHDEAYQYNKHGIAEASLGRLQKGTCIRAVEADSRMVQYRTAKGEKAWLSQEALRRVPNCPSR